MVDYKPDFRGRIRKLVPSLAEEQRQKAASGEALSPRSDYRFGVEAPDVTGRADAGNRPADTADRERPHRSPARVDRRRILSTDGGNRIRRLTDGAFDWAARRGRGGRSFRPAGADSDRSSGRPRLRPVGL